MSVCKNCGREIDWLCTAEGRYIPVDPEPRTRDGRISGKKARELAENIQESSRFEAMYPGYLMSEARDFYNDVNGGCYLEIRLYKEDTTFIRLKQKSKKRRQKSGSNFAASPVRAW